MIKRLAALLLSAALIFLVACNESESSNQDSIEVYRVVKKEFQTDGELVKAETIAVSQDADRLHYALAAVAQESASQTLEKALPDGMEIISYSIKDGRLIINSNAVYLELTGIEKTITDYCLALTFCALDEVESVSIYVEGTGITLGLRADDILLYDAVRDPAEKTLRLYYAAPGGRYLTTEHHTLAVSDDTNIERCVMEELLRGPNREELSSVMPEDTRLMSINTVDGLCTVHLSQEFISNMPDTVAAQRLTVFSIVNSLTAISEVDAVRLAVSGTLIQSYGAMSINGALERNDKIIGPENSAKGEVDVDIFMATTDTMELVGIAHIVTPDEYYSLEYTLVSMLMGKLEEPGFFNPITTEGVPNSVETRSGVCHVDVPASTFDGLSDAEIDLAVGVIAATLTGVNGVDSVTISLDGTVYAQGLTAD